MKKADLVRKGKGRKLGSSLTRLLARKGPKRKDIQDGQPRTGEKNRPGSLGRVGRTKKPIIRRREWPDS